MTGPDPDLKKGSGGPMPDLTQRGIRLHEKNEKKNPRDHVEMHGLFLIS